MLNKQRKILTPMNKQQKFLTPMNKQRKRKIVNKQRKRGRPQKTNNSDYTLAPTILPEGGKNASKFVIPPKMALGEGILFPPLGVG